LQTDGVVEPLRGEGLRIARQAADRCRKDRARLLKERLTAAISDCRRGGLSASELRTLIQDVLQETASAGTST
jgi:GntR family transcriptional regulator